MTFLMTYGAWDALSLIVRAYPKAANPPSPTNSIPRAPFCDEQYFSTVSNLRESETKQEEERSGLCSAGTSQLLTGVTKLNSSKQFSGYAVPSSQVSSSFSRSYKCLRVRSVYKDKEEVNKDKERELYLTGSLGALELATGPPPPPLVG
jgi:hypothetical protein